MAKDVVLKITGDASGAVRALQQVTQSAAQAQGRLQKMQKNFQQYLLKTEIANRGLKSRSLINARADQIAAFERSHKFLTAQTQELYRQKYLNQQIAKSDTATWRQKLAAQRQLLQLENRIGRAQQNNKRWRSQYLNARRSWNNGQYYAGPITSPEQYTKSAPVPFGKYMKQLGTSAMGHFSTGQNALFGAMGTATMATGAIYSFMRFVEPGGDVAQLIKNIKAVTGNDVSDLATEVKRLGRTTPYTTRQVAQAAYTMSKAGYDAKSIREMISGSVYMGLATDTDPNAAADITAQTLSHFGLKANMARRVTNLYSKAMVSSPAGLTDLAYTMQYAAPAAMLAKTDFSTTLAMSGILAKNGLKGSKAGTGLRAIFTKLSTAETNKSAKVSLDTLGIKTKDLKGNLKPVTVLFAELNKSLKNLPTTAKTAHLKNIFGQIAMGAASILIEKSGDNNELVKYIQELREGDNANIAAVIAKQKQDSFQGDLASLSSAWEGVRIAVFDAVEEKLRNNAQGLTDLALKTAQWINENEKTVQQWFDIGKYIVAAIGASAALQAAWGLLAFTAGGVQLVWAGLAGVAHGIYISLMGARDMMTILLATSAGPAIGIGVAFASIPLSIYLAYKYSDQLLAVFDTIGEYADAIGEKIKSWLPEWAQDVINGASAERQKKQNLAFGTIFEDQNASKYSLQNVSAEERKAVLHRETLNALAAQKGIQLPVIIGKGRMLHTAALEKRLIKNGIVPNSGNWEYQKIYAAVKNRYEKANAGYRNASEYNAMVSDPTFKPLARKEAYRNHLAEVAKEKGNVARSWLEPLIKEQEALRNIPGTANQSQNAAAALQALSNVGANAGVFAGGGGSVNGNGQATSAPPTVPVPAAPTITPEMLQTLAAQAKPANNTVTVGGTSVNVSVHCDASSIQTFVNQVVEAAKPQIDAIITAQVEKVKGALNSMGTGKKATAASML